MPFDFNEIDVDKAVVFLWNNLQIGEWSYNKLIYDISLTLLCFHQLSRKATRDILQSQGINISLEMFLAGIEECIENIVRSQNCHDNADGSWDATIWIPKYEGQNHPDIGATSFALQVLEKYRFQSDKYENSIKKGLQWLLRQQNHNGEDSGSWNDLSGKASINKTCDALMGILVGKKMKLDVDESLNRAIRWILDKEKPIFENYKISGWGWKSDTGLPSLENTCLLLEVFLKIEDNNIISLPLLVDNAQWLMKQQRKAPEGDINDGKWDSELTSRLTHTLIKFYAKIKDSALFQT